MLEKIAYYLFVFPLSLLPLKVLYLFSGLLYGVFKIFPYRKEVITNNLKRSFPELNEVEITKIRSNFYKHFCDILVEGVKNISISEKELKKRFKVINPEIMDELYQKEKSVLLVSGHYNNWEWLISIQNKLFPHQAMGIGMPMTSKFWDKKINERRSRFGMKVVHSKNFKEEIEQISSQPIAILTLSDQSPGDSTKSYWMNFLHQNTAVLFGAEQMAHTYNFAVVYFKTRKIKRGFFEMELILISDEPKSMQWGEITEGHAQLLEQQIQETPECWMWSHKRWKRDVPADLNALKKIQKEKFNEKFK